jgi:hypothetical protein
LPARPLRRRIHRLIDAGPPVAGAVADVEAAFREPGCGADVAVGVAVEAAAPGAEVGGAGLAVGGGAGGPLTGAGRGT